MKTRKDTIALVLAAFVAGLGGVTAFRFGKQGGTSAPKAGPTEEQRASALLERYTDGKGGSVATPPRPRLQVPLGGPSVGPVDAKVNLVMFADFQCPHSAAVQPVLARLRAEFKDKVRFFFRNYPGGQHQDAGLAAEAALAAHAQGKFWPMHDKLFAHQKSLGRKSLDTYAAELGLDTRKFKMALDRRTYRDQVDADSLLGQALHLEGTPSFTINGRILEGAHIIGSFVSLIEEELSRAETMLAEGVAPADLHDSLLEDGEPIRGQSVGMAAGRKARMPRPDPRYSHRVELGTLASRPAASSLVTIVQFSSFDCERCRRAEPILAEVLKKYGDSVRVAWRDLPVSGKPDSPAMRAALAARAADQQLRFWELRDRLMAERNLSQSRIEAHARSVGADVRKLRQAMRNRNLKVAVSYDLSEGARFGLGDAPAFFINGRFLDGEPTVAAFSAKIDEAKKYAETLIQTGESISDLYGVITRGGFTRAGQSALEFRPEDSRGTAIVPVDKSPARGPVDAPVTIVVFGGFECPFTKRLNETLDRVERAYPGQIRRVWKHFPLEEHPRSELASEAAVEAAKQGKFWQLHDRLFAAQGGLDRAALEEHARAIGLDMGAFKAALDSRVHQDEVEQDLALGTGVMVSGSPSSFLNGRPVPGTYPFITFKAMIEQELTKREIARISQARQ